MHWSPSGSAKDKWHLADDATSFETSSEIFHHQHEGEGEKQCTLAYPVPRACLLTFGYLNKLPGGEKGAWILISCCFGKVNGKGTGQKTERVFHQRAFMTVPPYSLQGQVASCYLGQDRPEAERQAVFVFLWSQSTLQIEEIHCLMCTNVRKGEGCAYVYSNSAVYVSWEKFPP